MRIAACLGVRDEVELVGPAIEHLRRIGVDLIIACDAGSTDGTYEYMERLRSKDDFWLFRCSDEEPDNGETWARAQVALVKSANVDWTIFLDADEFWLPRNGRLADCEELHHNDILLVRRFNIPISMEGPYAPDPMVPANYGKVLLLNQDVERKKEFMLENPNQAWVLMSAVPKAMARPSFIGTIRAGAHDVIVADSRLVRKSTSSDILIAHLPFTTKPRFQRKLRNIRRLLGVHREAAGSYQGWHWRRWLQLEDEGKLDDEFEKSVFTQADIDHLLGAGILFSADDLLNAK
ncbi:glycosyltransferase family 2 protein [Corticibacter populi]|nr:glycosyltransferase family 2 protein [Corticibacter populi]RZS33046.1 glycosyl transferase family 2 [Corticibacter populi]